MPSVIPRAVSAATSRKGLMLAERRRAHLVELYKSGRWKRYFDEREFLARMREAVREVEFWSAAIALWDEPAAPQEIRIVEPQAIVVPGMPDAADAPVHPLGLVAVQADQVVGGSLS